MTRQIRVGSLDIAMAGDPVWAVAGPVAGDVQSQSADVLARTAAHGPRFRVSLIPGADGLCGCTDRPGALTLALWVSPAGQVQVTATTPPGLIDRVTLRRAFGTALYPPVFEHDRGAVGADIVEAIPV